MCGIYITNKKIEKEEFITNLNRIHYRGPDNLGYTKIGNFHIGHLRLSIVDLDDRSNQPFVYKSLYLTFNGEIYNYKEIRNELEVLGEVFQTNSDTEVLIKGYHIWKNKLLEKLNGMFSFAIYDVERNKIFCARDRLGVKPLYYSISEEGIDICSQLQPIINENSKVCTDALSLYLDYGYVPTPYSIIKDVKKLKPGNYLEIDIEKKTYVESSYWDLKTPKYVKYDYEKAKSNLHELLIDSVRIRLVSDVKICTFLSGGIDSALVSSIASKINNEKINTFTIGFEDRKYDESKIAKIFSETIGTIHTEKVCLNEDLLNKLEIMYEYYDEPFADSSALPSLLLNEKVKTVATVALSGDGGDESFFGYYHFDLINRYSLISKIIPLFLRKFIAKFNLKLNSQSRPETIKSILTTKSIKELIYKVFKGYDSLQLIENKNIQKEFDYIFDLSNKSIQNLSDINTKLWLVNDSNVKVDRASMASSVEVRSPFLDYRIVEFARNLPISYRYNSKIKKRILKDILSEYIPEEKFNLPKKGFSIPLKDWLRNDLKSDIIYGLDDEFLNRIENLNVVKFKNMINKFYNEDVNYSSEIWRLYMLKKWNDKYKLL